MISRRGRFTKHRPKTDDSSASIYEKLGINREIPVYTASKRPVFLAHHGRRIEELF